MAMSPEFEAHLRSGTTTLCRAWALIRRDGVSHGFTDHDRTLSFDGITFRADTGLAAYALQQSTGLSIDNTEAIGVLSDDALTEADIDAGRFDGAEVQAWLVNWQSVTERWLQFRGSIGEISRGAGSFTAEVRGLSEALNRPQGRVYQAVDSVVLGDDKSQFDIRQPGFFHEGAVDTVVGGKVLSFAGMESFDDRWFENGRIEVLTGAAAGLIGWIKNDRLEGPLRRIELWEVLRAPVAAGDQFRLDAGYDGRFASCKSKLDNTLNFRGFPHIPGDDWVMAYPSSRLQMEGESLQAYDEG